MIRYILECMAFQLLFLIIYDLFLKRETFFQWNRAYLLGTFVLSLLLPWIKLEAFKTVISQEYFVYPEYLWDMDRSQEFVGSPKPSVEFSLSTPETILYGGMLLAALLFGYKLYQIIQLKRKGKIRYFKNYTRVVVRDSNVAFSFFRSIFLGDRVPEEDHKSIVQHELVHIGQRHSWDLLFFESMRIVGWFNPLVYIYQNRISELHEFIADAQVAKTHRAEQYQLLLSQVFQTRYISFVNPFFRTSLIKKRIVMLQKSESKQIWRLKYLLLLPLIMGMLVYTAAESQVPDQDPSIYVPFAVVEEVPIFPGCENASDLRACFNEKLQEHIAENFRYPEEARKKGINGRVNIGFVIQNDGSIGDIKIRGPDKLLEDEAERIISLLPQMTPGKHKGKTVPIPFFFPITFNLDHKIIQGKVSSEPDVDFDIEVPFSVVEEVPIFPGCEDAADPRACFNKKMQDHIAQSFRYPEEAQKQNIQGRVNILFTIGEDGSIGNVRMRGPDKLLEDEAGRIISLLPQMTPGKQRGKVVRVPYSIPITFRLQGPSSNDGSPIENPKADSKIMAVTASIIQKDGVQFLMGTVYTTGLMGLPGANISIEGKGRGGITDFDGAFMVEVEKGDNVSFQYVGLPTAMLKISDEKDYKVMKTE